MRVKIYQSARRRHRIRRASVMYVLEHGSQFWEVSETGVQAAWWLGRDDRGVELELAGEYMIDNGERVLVIFHAMPARYNRRRGTR